MKQTVCDLCALIIDDDADIVSAHLPALNPRYEGSIYVKPTDLCRCCARELIAWIASKVSK